MSITVEIGLLLFNIIAAKQISPTMPKLSQRAAHNDKIGCPVPRLSIQYMHPRRCQPLSCIYRIVSPFIHTKVESSTSSMCPVMEVRDVYSTCRWRFVNGSRRFSYTYMRTSIKMRSIAKLSPSKYQHQATLARRYGTIIRYRREPGEPSHQCTSHRSQILQLAVVPHTTGQRYCGNNIASITLSIPRAGNHRQYLLGRYHRHAHRLLTALLLARGLVPTPCREPIHFKLYGDGLSL